jgi:hypothetical protein
MHLIQMMLIYRHRHKLPNAFIESAVNYQIGTGAEGGANAFVVDGRPFPNERNRVCPRVWNPCLFRLRQRVDVSDDDAEYNRPLCVPKT